MLKFIRYSIYFFLAVCFVQPAVGQTLKLRKSPNLKLNPAINPSQLSKIMAATEKTLNEYAAAAKLVDLQRNRVTEESIERFNSLFTPNARIVKDYAEFIPVELIPYEDYALEVFNMLKLKGVQMIVQSAELVEVKYSSLGFYEPIVVVSKKVFNSLSSDGSIKMNASGNDAEQKFTFDIFKDDLTRANISRINHAQTKNPPGRYNRFISISAGAGTASWNPSFSSYWDKAHSDATLDVGGGLNFSLGAEFMTNRFITPKTATKRMLAFSLGLRYHSMQLKSELRSFSIEAFDQTANQDTVTQLYRRMVGPVFADENIRFGVLEIPIGIGIKLMKKQNAMVFLHARFIPGFVLSGSGDLTGDGEYVANLYVDPSSNSQISEAFFGKDDDNKSVKLDPLKENQDLSPYKVGDDFDKIDQVAKPELASTVMTVQLSPTGYFKLSDDNPGWGVMVGLDLGYQLGSFIKHNPATSTMENALKYNDDFEGSLLSYYTEKVSGFRFGVRIGLFHQLNTNP